MYLFKKGLLPNYFRDIFTPASQTHSHKYKLRESTIRFHISLFPCQGPKSLNSVSKEIQNSENIGLVGKRLKNSLFPSHMNSFVELRMFSFLPPLLFLFF